MNLDRALQCKPGLGQQEPQPSARDEVSRRNIISGIPLALATACTLGACGTNPAPRPVSMAARHVRTELDVLINGTPELVVAGEKLNTGVLQRFYARHGFAPVWTTREAQAHSLSTAVLSSARHGLNPDLFHAALLRRRSELPPLDRELILSDAFLSYADALAHGAVPVERRRPFEELAPEPVDVAAALDAAADRPDPAAAIEALAPATPTYMALRQALQSHRSGAAASGQAGKNRLRMIEVNLERERWMPRQPPADRVWVNAADQRLILYRADRPVFSTRVVVGNESERDQSPEFRAMIQGIFFNPPWVVPRDIVLAEILPRIRRDPDYLLRNNMFMRDNGEVEQRPGPNAGLGFIMFDMPNRFDVYLHDTPARHVFGDDNRRLSHGCIRVENPRELSELLMQEPIETIHQAIATGVTSRRDLPTPVPVFVIYETAFADANGILQFRPDFYGRDARILQQMQRVPGTTA
jgi:murein L,D-transpeptidase YcbB/YkuD